MPIQSARLAALIAAAVLSAAASAAAAPPPQVGSAPAAAQPPAMNQLQQTRAPEVSVICGLTIVQGDPRIDPAMTARLPRPDVKHTMPKIVAPMCRSSELRKPEKLGGSSLRPPPVEPAPR